MVTLVLVFCVGLLVYEMARQGQDPLALAKATVESDPQPQVEVAPEVGTQREVTLFFANADARSLVGEVHHIQYSDYTVDNCRRVLEQLIAGPRDILNPVVPSSVTIRGLYLLEDGTLVADMSGELVTDLPRSAVAEALMAYGVTQTLCQSALVGEKQGPVKRVRFLVEGASPDEYLPGEPRHLDLSAPWEPSAPSLGTAANESPK